MEFKLNNLEYAWVGNELRHIASGNKSDKYFLDEDLTIPLVFCKGIKIKSYWRKEPNIDDSVIRDFFGSSESVEHYNKKIELSKSLELQFGKHLIIGNSSKVEYRVKSINKIIDLIFLDKNGHILVGIEVLCTNKKTYKDIKKFNEVKFPIYEYNINTGEVYPISSGCTNTEEIKVLSRQVREIETSISENKPRLIRGKRILFRQQNRIKAIEKGIKRLDNKRKEIWRDYYKFKEAAEYLSDEGYDKVIREKDENISSFRDEIKEYGEQQEELRLIQNIKVVKKNISIFHKESRILQGNIAAENRREYNLREEFRKDVNAL
jgi:hypothetical protein